MLDYREHIILLSRERGNKGAKRMNSLPVSSFRVFYLTLFYWVNHCLQLLRNTVKSRKIEEMKLGGDKGKLLILFVPSLSASAEVQAFVISIRCAKCTAGAKSNGSPVLSGIRSLRSRESFLYLLSPTQQDCVLPVV